MEQWLSESLSRILAFEVPEDLINYILDIKSEGDLNEYMKTLLDFDNPQHKNFYLELSRRKFSNKGNSLPKQQKKKISKSKTQSEAVTSVEEPPAISPEKETAGAGKKKTKYVNLYSQEGKNAQVVLLKGRHHCECQASKHELVNNCVKCGRIVCKQEGSGPCLFCRNLVCTPAEQRELNQKTRASAALAEQLREKGRPRGWEAAVTHRNRLLEFDRTSERRTRVTDDDSDYFSSNSVWMSASEREKLGRYQQSLHEKKHAGRLSKKMNFDFAGRQIVEDTTIEHEVDEEKIREMTSARASHAGFDTAWFGGGAADRDVAPGVNSELLQFDPSIQTYSSVTSTRPGPNPGALRVQDPELQEMCDDGRCLSLHQPWASLLVEGIKMHEGRTWYTSHRGRLWIASTAKPPDQEVVRALENQYRALYPDKQIEFPKFYPTGCLLGCVNVDDCLPEEEYQKKYPNGESESPFVFICSHPVSLKLRFPIKGQHKIYQLDKTIHQAAVKCIQKMSKIQADASG